MTSIVSWKSKMSSAVFSLYAPDHCRKSTRLLTFGLVDPAGSHAEIDIDNESAWIGRVSNPSGGEVTMLAIDKCADADLPPATRRCDGALITALELALFELKTTRHRRDEDGIQQLRDTIANLSAAEVARFRRRTAYVCNKRHPNFAYGRKDAMQSFRDATRFFLRLTTEIELRS